MSWPPSALRKQLPVTDPAEPPITPLEMTSNLTTLEHKLNREMKCVAGKNQVYLRSLVTPKGPTRPRVTLKCHLRRDIGQKPEVFFEHIRDVCCNDPSQCEAFRAFQRRHVKT